MLTFVGQPIYAIRPQGLFSHFAHETPTIDREYYLCPLDLFLEAQPHIPEEIGSIIFHRLGKPFGFLYIELACNFNITIFKYVVLVVNEKLLDKEWDLISLVVLEPATSSAKEWYKPHDVPERPFPVYPGFNVCPKPVNDLLVVENAGVED